MCPISGANIAPMQQVDYVGGEPRAQGNLYTATYNPWQRNHTNFHAGIKVNKELKGIHNPRVLIPITTKGKVILHNIWLGKVHA